MTFKTEAFVLRARPWRAADRLYYLFIPQEGVIQAVLKAAAKSTSKLAGHLPMFAKVKVMIGRGRLDHLAGVTLIKDYQNLRTNIKDLSLASSIIELFLGEMSRGFKQAEFYLLEEILDLLNSPGLSTGQKSIAARAFLWKFLSLSGWQPQLNYCVICHKRLLSGDYLPGHGIVCYDHKAQSTLSMSKDLLQFLREVLDKPLPSLSNQVINKDLNKEWLQASQAYYQEVYDRPSQALKLFIYG